MMYVRGNPKDFDHWSELGNDGWSWSNVLPYFKKTEHNYIQDLQNSKFHGYQGLLSVNRSDYTTSIAPAFLNAAEELNLKITDYNSDQQTGFAKLQVNTKDGKRHSAFQAFLEKSSKNLRVSTDTLVTKILIDPIFKHAKGVEVVKNGKTMRVFAKKEVILSAGTFESPKLLMLSGVGRKNQLQAKGIRVVKDLRVGAYLKDHVAIKLRFKGEGKYAFEVVYPSSIGKRPSFQPQYPQFFCNFKSSVLHLRHKQIVCQLSVLLLPQKASIQIRLLPIDLP